MAKASGFVPDAFMWIGPHKPDSVSRRLAVPGCDHLSVGLSDQPAPAYAVVRLLPGVIHPLRDLRPGGPFSCSVLHRMRFVVPPSSRSGRWALTPPFHPYPHFRAGGLFSVTLSVTAACTAAPTLSCGMLPCGVRTFLWHPALRQNTSDHSDRPAGRVAERIRMSNLNSRRRP